MESTPPEAAEMAGPEASFSAVLQEVSRSLGAQVSLAGGCLGLHPRPPPGYRDTSARAVAKLRTAVDEFWLEVLGTSGPAKPTEPQVERRVSLDFGTSSRKVVPFTSEAQPVELRRQHVLLEAPPVWRERPLQDKERKLLEHRASPVPSDLWRVPVEEEGPLELRNQLTPIHQPNDWKRSAQHSEEKKDTDEACADPQFLDSLKKPLPSGRLSSMDTLPPLEESQPVDILKKPGRKESMDTMGPERSGQDSRKTSTLLWYESQHSNLAESIPTRSSERMSRRQAEDRLDLLPQNLKVEEILMDADPTVSMDTMGLGSVTSAMALGWREDAEGGNPFWVEGVLNPNWIGRLGWDFAVIALVMADAMVLPFQMAYKHGEDPDAIDKFWLWLTTSFFGADLIISFFTAYAATARDKDMEPGRLVTKKGRIVQHYLRGWFSIDFVSTIPWSTLAEAIASDDASSNSAQVAKLTKVVKFVRFLRLMRMLRLAKLGVIWERIEAKLGSLILLQMIALFRVLFIVVSICHWNACIWWMLGHPKCLFTDLMTEEGQRAWEASPHWTTLKRANDMESEPWSWLEKERTEAYVFCFYWTLGVMRTMPAEVQPVNLVERVYVMCFMFFAVSAFAISVTLITQAFLKIGERRRIFNEDMAFVRMHLRNIQASESLQAKVKSYLLHLFNRRRIQAKEANLFGQLPQGLTKLMKSATIRVHLTRLSFLSGLSKKALTSLADVCEIRDLIPGERLCKQGEVAKAGWILVAGRLAIVSGDCPEFFSHAEVDMDYNAVQIVDEECLGTRRSAISPFTVVAKLPCEVVYINKKKFFKVFKDNPHFFTMMQIGLQANHRASTISHVESLGSLSMTTDPSHAGFERGLCLEEEEDEEAEETAMRRAAASHGVTAAMVSA